MKDHMIQHLFENPATWFGPADRGYNQLQVERARRAVSYHRFSKLGESPDSIERQQEGTREYRKRIGLTLVREYNEPRASGVYLENRDVLQRLIAEIDDLNVGVVIVESTDRLGRSIAVLGRLWGELQDRGIEIHDASAGVVVDSVRLSITAGHSEEERRKIVRNLESGRNRAARSGVPIMGRCLGYRFVLDSSGKRVRAIDPDEARTVKEVFDLFLKGMSPSAIARYLNSETPGGRHGKTWRRSNICGSPQRPTGILRRLRYTGVQTFRATANRRRRDGRVESPRWRPVSEWIRSPMVPELQIISPRDFMAAQRKLARADRRYRMIEARGRSRNPNWGKRGNYALAGLVCCALCGGRMFIRSYGREGKALQCGNTSRGGGKCRSAQVALYRVEDGVAALLGPELETLRNSDLFVQEYNAAVEARVGGHARESASITSRLQELSRVWDATFDEAMVKGFTDERLFEKREALRTEEDGLRARLAELQADAAEQLVLRREKGSDLNQAMARILGGEKIDTSTHEGIELLAAIRALVAEVRVAVRSGDLEIRMDISPAALSDEPMAEAGTVELSGVFPEPTRGYSASPRFAAAAAKLLAEGKHRLSDEQWQAVAHLLPPLFQRTAEAPALRSRAVLEAALFHLQNKIPMAHLPEDFGPPAEMLHAIRRLARVRWRRIVPVLKDVAPGLLQDVRGSKMLPVGADANAPGDGRRTLTAKLASGLHRLDDGEWVAISSLLPAGELAAAGLAGLEPRRLADAAIFLAKERIYPSVMPRLFGPRELAQNGCWWLHSRGRWRDIVAALEAASPQTLRGADLSLFDRYWAPERTYRLRGRRLDRGAVAALLEQIDADASSGYTSREAAARAGVPYTTYLKWRTNPAFRRKHDV